MTQMQVSEQKLQESYSLTNFINNDKIQTVEQALQDRTTPSLATLKKTNKDKTLAKMEANILSVKDIK